MSDTPSVNPPAPGDASSSSPATRSRALLTGAGVIVISSVMFTFIGYWRTAAVVLCDLASTSYYIGAIVELSVGRAAPWFILAVMCFSYAVRWVYIESCTLFVRGGVYRVVREAMGPFMAKFAVSALMFDYILTGPISSVSAGQYLIGLALDALKEFGHVEMPDPTTKAIKNWGSVILACLVTTYFFYENLRGIHESSEKALKIMGITTVMGVIMILWCLLTLVVRGMPEGNTFPSPVPQLTPRHNHTIDPPHEVDPTGFLSETDLAKGLRGKPVMDPKNPGEQLRVPLFDKDGKEVVPAPGAHDTRDKVFEPNAYGIFSLIGLFGVAIAFGHSILAMSGEETLAQVYREVESPKLLNFQKAAFIVFVFSIVLTGFISFLAVLLIPDKERLSQYGDNLIGGLAMQVLGPPWARYLLRVLVVIVGFLILSGAVNTAIIGSNGVLNRVAEDGVMPDWFLKPHPRYGTTFRILVMIYVLQIVTIVASRGDVFILGEAYAFGVVWSFVFQALSMMVLRFKIKKPREFKVPGNLTVNGVEYPIGLGLILLILLVSAVVNFLTKEVATIGGVCFTLAFFALFTISEKINAKKLHGAGKPHQHLEQFNQQTAEEVTSDSLGLTKSYRKLVSIRSTMNLYMLEKALAETDPETTGVVVMTAKFIPPGSGGGPASSDTPDIDAYDQELMTKVVDLGEKAGKPIKPLIVPTNNPLHAILKMAKDIQAHELIMGASNKYTADEQLEQIGFYWVTLHDGNPAPLTVRLISRERDMYLDLAGGNRIPSVGERRAKSVDELRAMGVGVDRVLMLHDGSPADSDLFQAVLTMLDEDVALGIANVVPAGSDPHNGHGLIVIDERRAAQVGKKLTIHDIHDADGPAIVETARQNLYDMIILPLPPESSKDPIGKLDARAQYIVRHAHCRVLIAAAPGIPDTVVDSTPSVVRG